MGLGGVRPGVREARHDSVDMRGIRNLDVTSWKRVPDRVANFLQPFRTREQWGLSKLISRLLQAREEWELDHLALIES